MGISRETRLKLEKHGIHLTQDLVKIRDLIKENKIPLLLPNDKEKLLWVSDWIDRHPDAIVAIEFDGKDFCKLDCSRSVFISHLSAKYPTKLIVDILGVDSFAKSYHGVAMGKPLIDTDLYEDVEQNPEILQKVIENVIDDVEKSPHLLAECDNFDYKSFIARELRHFHELVGHNDIELINKKFVVTGRTQIGKSAVKGVVQCSLAPMNIPIIIITNGNSESLGLYKNLRRYAAGGTVDQHYIVAGMLLYYHMLYIQ